LSQNKEELFILYRTKQRKIWTSTQYANRHSNQYNVIKTNRT